MGIKEVNRHRATLDHVTAYAITVGNTRKVADEPQLIRKGVHVASTKSVVHSETRRLEHAARCGM